MLMRVDIHRLDEVKNVPFPEPMNINPINLINPINPHQPSSTLINIYQPPHKYTTFFQL